MDIREQGQETSAVLVMAGQLRFALAERDAVMRASRERYERALRDPRLLPAKRDSIAAAFIQAAYRADHAYEAYLNRAVSEIPLGQAVGQ